MNHNLLTHLFVKRLHLSFISKSPAHKTATMPAQAESPIPRFVGRRQAGRLLIVLVLPMLSASCNGSSTVPPPTPTPPGHTSAWLTRKGSGSVQEAGNYYQAIGAFVDNGVVDAKETFDLWKTANGFSAGAAARAVYFNGGDLEIGRDMNCNQVGVKIACYVTNYGPAPDQPGWPNASTSLTDALSGNNAFATVAMEFTPFIIESDVTVKESDGITSEPHPTQCPFTTADGPPSFSDVDTGIDIGPGDTITFDASGKIWGGVCLTDTNGPEGWRYFPDEGTYLPLSASDPSNNYPFALIGKLDGGYFYIGPQKEFIHQGQWARLLLRTNDNLPGNGTGAFSVHIKVVRANNVTFYVYGADGNLARQAALDPEGPKNVPQICLACHGGIYSDSTHSVVGASFLPFDLESFVYSQAVGYTRQDQEEAFRKLNALVRDTSPNPTNTHNPIVTFIDGMYPGGVGTSGTTAMDTYVPPGWSGKPNVYAIIIKPYCRTCHMAMADYLDLTEYTQFTSLAARIQDSACVKKDMPHAAVPYKKFWGTTFPFPPGYLEDPSVLGIDCVP